MVLFMLCMYLGLSYMAVLYSVCVANIYTLCYVMRDHLAL